MLLAFSGKNYILRKKEKVYRSMGYNVKVQKVQRPKSKSFYVNLPSPIAEAMNLEKGEDFYWEIEDKNTLVFHRANKLPPRNSSKE